MSGLMNSTAAAHRRVQEVKASIAGMLGCRPDELGQGAYSRVVVSSLADLTEHLGEVEAANVKPSFAGRLVKLGREMHQTELAFERVGAVVSSVAQVLRRRSESASIYVHDNSGRWLLVEPVQPAGTFLGTSLGDSPGASSGTWQSVEFTKDGFVGEPEVFEGKAAALAKSAARGFLRRDDSALMRHADEPKFVRAQVQAGLNEEVAQGQMSPQQALQRMRRFDEDQAHYLAASAGAAQAFYVASADKIFLVADRIAKGAECAVYLHETVHKHARWVLGDLGFERLVGRVQGWSSRAAGSIERIIFEQAHQKAASSLGMAKVGGALYKEELLAYAVEEAIVRGVTPNAQALEGSAQEWFADVLGTLKGVREQLLDAKEPMTMQQLVDMAYAMAQLDSPQRGAQLVQALVACGEDPEFVEAMRKFATRSALFGADTDLVRAIDQVYSDPRMGEIKAKYEQLREGPFELGSLIAANAIKAVAGAGQIVCITGEKNGPSQYGLAIGGFVYDFDGAHPSEQDWLASYDANVNWDNSDAYAVAQGLVPGRIGHDERACEDLTILLAEHKVRSEVLDQQGQGGRPGPFEPQSQSASPRQPLPDCLLASPMEALLVDSDYRKARQGDEDSALLVARKMVSEKFIQAVRDQVGNAFGQLPAPGQEPVIFVAQTSLGPGGQINAVPLAMATVLAQELGGEVCTDIVQTSRASVEPQSVVSRVLKRPEFSGPVVQGRRYFLVDDRLTLGAGLAALAQHIAQGGGAVVGMSAAFGASGPMQVQPKVLDELRQKYGDLEHDFEAATGVGFDGLTQHEARALAALRAPQEFRDRIAQEAGPRDGAAPASTGTSERAGAGKVGPAERDFAHNLAHNMAQWGLRASFAGRKSVTQSEAAFNEARQMEGDGHAREEIFAQTGWFLGPDAKWRYEVDDSKSSLLISGFNLRDAMPAGVVLAGDILKHDLLFSAYPSLARVQVELRAGSTGSFVTIRPKNASGGGGQALAKIYLDPELRLHKAHGVLLHELQHAVQAIEAFSPGGDVTHFSDRDVTERYVQPINEQIMELLDSDGAFGSLRREQNRDFGDILERFGRKTEDGRDALNWDDVPKARSDAYFERMDRLDAFPQNAVYIDLDMERRRLYGSRIVLSAWDQYYRQAGEVEARAVESRRSMNEHLRRQKAPWLSQDVATGEILVRTNRNEAGLVALSQDKAAAQSFGRPSEQTSVQARRVPADPSQHNEAVQKFLSRLVRHDAMALAKPGDWVTQDYPDLRGVPVCQLKFMDLAQLYLPELDEHGRLQPEKRPYLAGYLQRMQQGEVPPAIDVIEMEDGRMRVIDGHRRVMAARAAGWSSLLALVSPMVQTPEGRVPATVELMVQALSKEPNALNQSAQLAQRGGLAERGHDVLFSFRGVKSAKSSAGSADLDRAKAAIAAGQNANDVRLETGWFTGVDGFWRQEIGDEQAFVDLDMLASLSRGGWGPFKAASVTYRRSDGAQGNEPRYDLLVVPVNPRKTADFVDLKSVGMGVIEQVLPAPVAQAITRGVSGAGGADFIGDLDLTLELREPFDFCGFRRVPLGAVLHHSALFDAYPQMRDVQVEVDPGLDLGCGVLRSGANRTNGNGIAGLTIALGPLAGSADTALSVLLHEVQHVIQDIEGFCGGATVPACQDALGERQRNQVMFDQAIVDLGKREDPLVQSNAAQALTYWGLRLAKTGCLRGLTAADMYACTAGEVEARNVQSRRYWSVDERRQTPPGQSADTPVESQIIREGYRYRLAA